MEKNSALSAPLVSCGKTTYLKRQVERALDKYLPADIVVASFTKAAAHEVARRIALPESNVGTIHALCYRIMGGPTIAEGKAAEFNAQCPAHLRLSGAASVDLDEPQEGGEVATDADRAFLRVQALRAQLKDPAEDHDPIVRGLYAAWTEWKHEQNYHDFTDLLAHCLDVGAQLPGDPRLLFVDETQDCSPLELALIRSWATHVDRLITVGDPWQCIYGFKGSDPHNFLTPALPKENTKVLAQSYRVPRVVHAAATKWISQSSYYEHFDYAPRDAEGALEYRPNITLKNPAPVIGEINRELDAGRSVMVLATCGYFLSPLLARMRAEGIPFHNPYRKKKGHWNPMRGGPERMQAFLKGSAAQGAQWTERELRRWAEILDAKTHGIFERGAKKRIAGLKRNEPIDPNILYELFDHAAIKEILDTLDRDAKDAGMWLYEHALKTRQPQLAYALALLSRGGAPALSEAPRVCVGTVHSVKGGEADTVFLFPDLSPSGYMEWAGHTQESRDAVRRLFYVGMTRARERLYLCGAGVPSAVRW